MPRSFFLPSLAVLAATIITPVLGCASATATQIEIAGVTTPAPGFPALSAPLQEADPPTPVAGLSTPVVPDVASTAPASATTPVAATLPALDAPELRAVWVDAFHDGFKTPEQVDELVAWARRANFNALFVQVRRRGDAYYAKTFEPRTEDPHLAPGFDALEYLIDTAHQGPQRLQVHAWLATLAIWNKRDTPPADPGHVFNRHGLEDTWLMLRDDGVAWAPDGSGGTYYLDPGHPEAARYTADVYLNVVRNYDVDGVHLDHVRYFEGDGDRRWGYNPASVSRFNQRYSREPGSVPDPSDPYWMSWRRDQVTALVRRIYLETKAQKPHVTVSGAVVAWGDGPDAAGGWDRSAPSSLVFQDWRYWLHEGIVDYVMPMDYYREATPQAGWFDSWVTWQQANRGKRGVVIGLGAFLNKPEETTAQLQRARAVGPLGVAMYSYAVPARGAQEDGNASREDMVSRLLSPFSRPAPIPDMPWHTQAITGNILVDVPGREAVTVLLSGPTTYNWLTDGTGLAGGLDVFPGTYIVVVSAPDFTPTPVEVVVRPGQTSVVRFPSSPLPTPSPLPLPVIAEGGGED
jgi:uncharacterized lipoprotein YddW (UPF0748 family)